MTDDVTKDVKPRPKAGSEAAAQAEAARSVAAAGPEPMAGSDGAAGSGATAVPEDEALPGEGPEAGGDGPDAAESDPFVVLAKTPGVVADDTIAEAGRKVLRFHLARMIAREQGTRLGEDARELHAMRVATRRQRAAWRVFGDGFRPGRTKRHRNRLRIVAGRLGAVRDRDVLIDGLEAYQRALPPGDASAIEPLIDEWRGQREDARLLLIRELDSEGYRRWVDDYREFTRHEGLAVAATAPTAPHRIRDTAASRIWLAYEQVRAYDAVLRWADVVTLHALRIAAKRLRYTLEFLREALGPEAGALIARVVVLQDHLGLLNDADVAATLTRTFLVEQSGELTEPETLVIGRYLVSREQEVARLRRTVGAPWRGLSGPAFRRALGRVTAGV